MPEGQRMSGCARSGFLFTASRLYGVVFDWQQTDVTTCKRDEFWKETHTDDPQ
jgi:hypothetical protein